MYLAKSEGDSGISAAVVAASRSSVDGSVLWTLETKAPKFIDAEFEKHRILSSSSSSSRAIPFNTPDPVYIPLDLRANQKGMQGYKKVSLNILNSFKWDMEDLLSHSVRILKAYSNAIHKQHLNRYTEAWTFQYKVVTGSQWENFFNLRLAKDVQPEMLELARHMEKVIKEAEGEIKTLNPGEWHLPYIQPHEMEDEFTWGWARNISAARCARVSYKNHDKTNPDPLKDLGLAHLLLSDEHMTPFEHQGSPMAYPTHGFPYGSPMWGEGVTHLDKRNNFWSGNFKAWVQHRQLINEWGN